MAERSVSIRLGTTGKADVTRTFDDIATSGDASAKRLKRSYEQAGEGVTASMQRQASAAAKLAMITPQSTTQMRINDTNSTGFGQHEGSARQSAAAFRDLFAAEEQMETRTRALLSAIDPAWAAQQRFNGEMAEAKTLLDAGKISADQYATAQDRSSASLRAVADAAGVAASKQAALYREQAGAARAEAGAGRVQASYVARDGAGLSGKSARDSAGVFQAMADAEAQLENRTRALLSVIDPIWAAQQRFNGELAQARSLLDAGRISTEQYAAAERMAKQALDSTTAASGRAQVQSAATRAGYQQLSFQISDVFTSIAGGMNPAVVFAQQFPQIVQAMNMIGGEGGEGGAAGAAGAIGGLTETLGTANDTFDATSGAAERLTTMMGSQSAAAGANTATTDVNATAHGVQTATTNTSTTAMGANTVSTNVNTASTEANAVATTGLAAAKARLLAFMGGPMGAVIIGGVTLLALMASKYWENKDASEGAADGMKTFQQRQSDIGNFIDDTTGRLKEQNRTLVLNAILTRQAQIAANDKSVTDSRLKAFERASDAATRMGAAVPGSTTSGVSFRDDTEVQGVIRGAGGDVDKLAAGLAQLARRRPELRAVALDVSAIGGQAILAGQDNERLGKELRALSGDTSALAKADTGMIEARAKLAGAVTTMDRAQAQYNVRIREADRAFEASNKTAADQAKLLGARTAAERDLNVAQEANRGGDNRREQSLGRQADAMEVNADAALDLARAYLLGGDAAMRAEAARKGLTDATKKGIDGEAQVRRQLAILIGDQLANSAKSVAEMREETAARAAVNAQVLAGTLPVDRMTQALSDEAALRPLLKLQTLAQGEALTLLTRIIGEYRSALADAHAEEANSNAATALDGTKARIAEIRAGILDLSKSPEQQAVEAARRAAAIEADAGRFTPTQRKNLIDQRGLEAQATARAQQARYILDALSGQEDALALGQRELELIGLSDDRRAAELEKLKIALDIRRRFPEMAEQDVQAILSGIDAQAALEAQIDSTAAAMDELRGFGAEFVDTVLSEDTWSSWGNAGKTMMNMLKTEFVKLALLNPLKNMITGENAPTITSFLGNIAKAFGAKGAAGSTPTYGTTGGLSGNAAGTQYWSGGASIVGENGAEIVSMPRGSRVTPAAETRRLLAGNDNGGFQFTYAPSIDARGAGPREVDELRAEMQRQQAQLPGQVVTAWQDARQRGIIR